MSPEWLPVELVMILRVVLAAVLGAIVGWERFHAGKMAGIRTHMLVSIGAALFTVTSMWAFGDKADAARLAAGVVAGIGFIGGGMIIRTAGGALEGLTTAAGIWAVSAIGLAAGAGMYIVAPVAAIIVFVVLLIPKRMAGQ